jgi:hypothetical protein
VVSLPFEEGYSSSAIIQRILKRYRGFLNDPESAGPS